MANAEKMAFFERYAPLAMAQQQKYGIPASITLAQMYIESAGGKSTLARKGNNYFGIKCTNEWLAAGKPYSLHNDDKPNEKFCNYASVEESIEHHSQFLMGKRYAQCRQCGSKDYQGWANGLKAAGYATNPNYARTIISEIKAYGLDKYDRQAKQLGPIQPVAKTVPIKGEQNSISVNLTPQQQTNAQAGAQLSAQAGSNNPNTLLAYLMGQNGDQHDYGQGDIFSALISGLFTSAIGMAMLLDQVENHQDTSEAQTQHQQQEQVEQQKAATLIQRKRDSIDPQQARETAMMNFDAEYPEEQRNTGQQLA